MDKVQVEILGLSTTPTVGGAYAILLRETNGTKKLPIIIGAFEAQAIALELEGIKPPRPLTHDLTKTIIEHLGGTLTEVIITDLKDNTFIAKIFLELSSLTYEIDSRPSDAIALAVRFKTPIFVNLTVLNEAGIDDTADEENEQEKDVSQEVSTPLNSKESLIAKMQSQLREAVEKEEYERAAKLRDELKKLLGEEN